MAEYIDREQLDKAYLMLGYGEKELPRRMLQMMPAADVAQVVRCKDCTMRQEYFNSGRFACKRTQCVICGSVLFINDDDFCSHGKRRTDCENNNPK